MFLLDSTKIPFYFNDSEIKLARLSLKDPLTKEDFLSRQEIFTTGLFEHYFKVKDGWILTKNSYANNYLVQNTGKIPIQNKVLMEFTKITWEKNFWEILIRTTQYKNSFNINSGVYTVFISGLLIAFFKPSDFHTKKDFTLENTRWGFIPLNPFEITERNLTDFKVKVGHYNGIPIIHFWDLTNYHHVPYIHALFTYMLNNED